MVKEDWKKKKVFCLVLITALFVGLFALEAFAASWAAPSFSPGDSTQTGNETKTSASGTAANVNISSQTKQWIYRIRKSDGVIVSNQLRFPSTGSHSLGYNLDGYGNSLGRNGYEYRLNVAYYSQASGIGSSYGVFTP